MFTAEQIRAAAAEGLPLWLNLGKNHAPAPCRLAASVRGWCTVVLSNGAIIQEWAGCFSGRYDEN